MSEHETSRRCVITTLGSIRAEPYPKNIDPYPAAQSYSAGMGLQVFDLITPDGDRVWAIAGWDDGGNIRAWPLKDLDRHPGKSIPDTPNRFAPLSRVNRSANLRESFIDDYLALNHEIGEQEYRIGGFPHGGADALVGEKIYPYQGSNQHIVRDYENYFRLLTLDPVRDGNPKHYVEVDLWEVTASWHRLDDSPRRCRRKMKHTQAPEGVYLYRLYDKGGRLLYVGITDNCFRRWKEHSRDKEWWGLVHQFTQDWYPDRTSVEVAERRAITLESPLYNKAHNIEVGP